MEIKMNAIRLINIFKEEIHEIEEFTGKDRSEITDDDYYKYLIEEHSDEIEIINN